MLLLSLVFLTVALLLGFSLMKDTGKHTVHARRRATRQPQVEASGTAEPAMLMK